MKAEIITYETRTMSSTQRSIISKRIFGYMDRTKGSLYTYQREGILDSMPHVVLTKKTFVLKSADAGKVKKIIKSYGATVKSWKIEISKKEMKKRYG